LDLGGITGFLPVVPKPFQNQPDFEKGIPI
jgi:hypothetical protein